MQRRMLSKEDEQSVGQEVEVRREDQDKINRFSSLHQRQLGLEQDLKLKHKEKEELDELSLELELMDEDEKMNYKIGDSFFIVPAEKARNMLEVRTARVDNDLGRVSDKLDLVRKQMTSLKVDLYARFGKSINLETD